MLNIPEEVRNLILSDGTRKNIRISFPNGERGDICNDKIVMNSVKFTESLCSQNELKLGLCEASVFSCEVVGVENVKGYKINVFCEIDCSSLGEDWCEENAQTSPDLDFPYYAVPYGVFYIDKCTKKSGDSLGHRNITAYTKEAYSNWGVPLGFQRFVTSGSPNGESLWVPTKAITSTMFPNTIEGEQQTLETFSSSSNAYYMVNGVRQYITAYLCMKRYIFNLNNVTAVGGYKSAIVKYAVDINNNARDFAKKCKSAIIEKVEEQGYTVFRPERILPYDDYCHIERKVGYQNTYYGVNTSTTGYYPTKAQDYAESIIEKYQGSFVNADFFCKQIGENWSASGSELLIIYVPYRIVIPLNKIYTPDFIEQEENLLGNDLNVWIDYEMGDNYIYVERNDSALIASRSFNINTGELGPIVNKTSYFSSETIDAKTIIEADAELRGLLGKFSRNGEFEYKNIDAIQNLYPSETLYPSESLYPQGTAGYTIPSTYTSAWYDDYLSKPYGRVCVTYKNQNDEDIWAYFDIVNDYNSDDYQEYSLTDNYIIRNHAWTSEEIRAILETIAERLSNIVYMPCDIDAIGQPWLEAGDTIAVETTDGDILKTIILGRTLSGEHFLQDNFESN